MSSVSCVILNYNDAETTEKLVRHIIDFQIINDIVVVDNLSKDDSFARLKLLENSKTHVIQADKNGGYGAGNNYGIKFASENLHADYVLIANPDVSFEEDCVEEFLERFQQDPLVAVVSAKQSNSTDCAWKNCSSIRHILATSLFFEIWLKVRNYPGYFFDNKRYEEVYAVPGSLLMVDVKKMLLYGMYDEDFFLYYEEFVLAHKFALAAQKTVLCLNTSYVHNHHVSISKTYRRWSQQHKILLNSAGLYLRKYKGVNKVGMFFAKIWFAYTKFEFFLYDLYKKIRGV